MDYFDLHAHHPCFGILNIEYPHTTFTDSFSIGVHPWYLTNDNKIAYVRYVTENIQNPGCRAVGECGLDKLCDTDFSLQKEAFEEMIKLSEQYNKPLIIHCVKAYNEIIQLHKISKPTQPWIIHGFRGKPQLALSLTQQGIYLSFGENYNEQSLAVTPNEYIFIETDESNIFIGELYKKAARIKHLSTEQFIDTIAYKRIF